MRIVQLTPGSGGSFYCENCLRDAGLVRALRKAGHQIEMLPLYLPLVGNDFADLATGPIFLGGVNVYLQQKSALFRRTPRWIDKVFDSARVLRWAARRGEATNPADLGETTLSMLRGPGGRQVKEVNRLADYLSDQDAPDVVCLSNAMLIGLAEEIKSRIDAPVVVILQDEDIFLDDLPDPYPRDGWEIIAERAHHVDAFIAVSHYYAERMRSLIRLPAERVHVVYSGIDPESYGPAPERIDPPAIGFLERMSRPKGLDILAEAFIILKTDPRFARLKLRITGGKTRSDEPFIELVRGRLVEEGVIGDVEFVPNPDQPGRAEFLRTLSALSVPARHAEAFGLYALEAMGAGVPVVLPDRGAGPELLEATGGGLLCEAEDPRSLAGQLDRLLTEEGLGGRLGECGRRAVKEKFNLDRMAADMVRVYESIATKGP